MNWASKARSVLTPRIWFTKRSGDEDESTTTHTVIVKSMDSKEEEGCCAELKEFVRAHYIECSAFAFFIIFGFFCIFNAFGFLGSNELEIRSAHYEQIMNDHCQFVENRNLNGAEGRTDHQNATLVSILAVVRHGDRHGLNKNGQCQVLSEQEMDEFNDYQSKLNTQNIKSLLKIPENVVNMELAPRKDECIPTTLTPRGAIQEFAMGKFLYDQYKDTSMFNSSDSSIKMSLTFSNLQRTYDSGVALVSGFLVQNQSSFTFPIEFKEGSYYYGCADPGCECNETVEILNHMARKERQGLYRLEVDEKIQHIAQKLSAEINYTTLNLDPPDIIDNLVTRYSCPRRPLPCNDDYCVSYLFFGDIFEYFSKQSQKLFDLNLGIERQYRVLSAYPILRYVGLMAEKIDKEIQLFASHDTIIGSILRILTDSGKYFDWQVFGARVVFEIYETPEKSKYLRVLYDGKDITNNLKFCTRLDYGLCPISDLKTFLKKGIFELAGFQSFDDTCRDTRKEFLFI